MYKAKTHNLISIHVFTFSEHNIHAQKYRQANDRSYDGVVVLGGNGWLHFLKRSTTPTHQNSNISV